MNSLASTLQRLHLQLRRSSLPDWAKLLILLGALVGVLFLLVHFWWLFALIALGYVIGRCRS